MTKTEMQALQQMLKRLEAEERPFACLSCGFENGCSVRGCQVIKKAAAIVAAAQEDQING